MIAKPEPDVNDIQRRLAEPFPAEDIEWRISRSGKKQNGEVWATCLAYLNNRAIMDRLDSVFGLSGWNNEFRPAPNDPEGKAVVCRICCRIGGEWIGKEDGAPNTQIEGVKGGLSDSMKRAAVQWGIGRYLYKLPEGWAITSSSKTNKTPNYAKSKDGSFYWGPPALPGWALPHKGNGGGGTEAAAANAASEGAAAPPTAPADQLPLEPKKNKAEILADMRAARHPRHAKNIGAKYQRQAKDDGWLDELKQAHKDFTDAWRDNGNGGGTVQYGVPWDGMATAREIYDAAKPLAERAGKDAVSLLDARFRDAVESGSKEDLIVVAKRMEVQAAEREPAIGKGDAK